jgi:UrcA family protein
MMKTVTAAAAVLMSAALLMPTVSQAQDVKSAAVSYADLDLATGDGQYRLGRRIAFAAETVCDLGEANHELKLAQATKACRMDSIAGAQPAYLAAIDGARRGTVTVGGAAALVVTAR